MPRAQKEAEDGDRDLNTCVLRNRRISPLQNRFGPARGVMLFQPPVGVATCGHRDDEKEDMQSSPHSPTPASCKVKPL
ncbi:hypothetical protein SCLCIDRAFT_21799 [Scleroderma citrinum Foug A]|uniref:Uncharacterized protein n=1 Tax=Scleroderma citrinum Foug A TaxID=1036808 RepID=A0A0C3E1J7_9AGAM|nr:hypothetical protein SCLCIDRAFT_21799 [Scleroderma citrinum Foug A]